MSQRQYIRDGRSPIPEKEITSAVMSAIRARNTGPEVRLRKALWQNGLRGYRLNWKKVVGRPDICFVGKKVAVFVHGCFWHRCPKCRPALPKSHRSFWKTKFARNVARDKKKESALRKEGWRVFVVWECQMKSEAVMGRIARQIKTAILRE